MERFVVRFLRAALAWLVAGVSVGVAMAVHPAWVIYRTAHLHMLLLGFVTMMIAGVAYHVLPRFAAAPLHSPRLAGFHFLLANVGVALLATGFVVRVRSTALAMPLLAAGGGLSAIGAYTMAWNLWRTLDRAAPPAVRLPAPRSLPVADARGVARMTSATPPGAGAGAR